MSKRPEFTIAKVTEQFEVSRSTLRRGLSDGRFPNAKKDHHGRWLIPVDDVLQAGFTPRKTWFNDPAPEPGSQGAHNSSQLPQSNTDANEHARFNDQAHMEKELAHERAQVDKLKALLEAERAHVESLRMALRMIEPGVNITPQEPTDTTKSPSEPETYADHPRVRKQSVFQRIFKRR